MRVLKALILATLLACGGAVSYPQGYLEPDAKHRMRIVDGRMFVSTQRWQRSPYFRLRFRESLPIHLLIDNRGMACIVPAEIWALSPQYAACPDGWLHRRFRYDA